MMNSIKAEARSIERVDFQPGQSVWVVDIVANGRVWFAQVEVRETLSHVTRVWSKSEPGYTLPPTSEVARAVTLAALDAVREPAFGKDPLAGAVEGGLGLETRAVLAAVVEQLGDEHHDREIQAAASPSTAMERVIATLGAEAMEKAIDVVQETANFYQSRPEVLGAKMHRRAKSEDNKDFIDPLNLSEVTDSQGAL